MTDMTMSGVPVSTQARIDQQAAPPAFMASFGGTAREYFGIWIVNVLLTIVTIGVYSAWAKVRRMRYFYGNTALMGQTFDYHAKGIHIFIGRLIVFGLLAIYQAAAISSPIAALVVWLLLMACLPWLIARSLRFALRVTSYRNVRFDFTGKAGGAFLAYIVGGFVSILSLGLLAPFASRWANNYLVNNVRYGDRALSVSVTTGSMYRAWTLPAAMMVVAGALLAGFALWVGPAVWEWYVSADLTEEEQLGFVVAVIYGALIPAFIFYTMAGIIYRVAVRNIVLSATLFDGRHQLVSDLGRARFFWIVFSNTIVVLCTLGLMRPWAAVREWRYVAEHTGIRIVGNVGEVMTDIEKTGSATSAEFLDLEGFDFGF